MLLHVYALHNNTIHLYIVQTHIISKNITNSDTFTLLHNDTKSHWCGISRKTSHMNSRPHIIMVSFSVSVTEQLIVKLLSNSRVAFGEHKYANGVDIKTSTMSYCIIIWFKRVMSSMWMWLWL